MRRRLIFRGVFVAVLLLLLIDSIAWAVLCGRLEQGVRDAAAAAPQSGWAIAAEGMRWGGWPLAAAIDLNEVSVAGSLVPGFVWRAERSRVGLSLFHPMTLSVQMDGPQSIEAQGVPPIPFTAARTHIAADLAGATPIEATVDGLTATLPTGKLTLDRAQLTFPLNAVTADLAVLSLPGFTTPIGAIRLRAAIDPVPQAPSAWHEAGGHIDIAEATVHWDTLDATGAGRITLDDRLQPLADGTIEATGLPRLLDDLAKAGALAPAQAGAAKAVLAILAAPTGGERVRLPISLADGVLRLARFPLVRFPPLAWN